MWFRKLGRLLPLLSLVLFGVALWVVHHALRDHSLHDVMAELRSIPGPKLALAFLFTAASYVILTGYDWLALRHIGRRVPYPKIALSSFVSYVFAHNIGLSLLTGGSIRYRTYSAEGLSALEIGTVTLLCGITFTLGATAIAGLALLLEPAAILSAVPLPAGVLRGAGVLCLAAVVGYVGWSAIRRNPIRLGAWELQPPNASLSLMQVFLAVTDIAVTTYALFVLLPSADGISFVAFLGVYVLAIVAGIISHIPGGVGVVEGVVLLLMPEAPVDALLASLLAFRVIYYLIPLCIAALLLAGYEFAQHRHRVVRAVVTVAGLATRVAPPVLGSLVLLSGVVLLLSGASPALDARIEFLRGIVPLPVLEASHLIGSLAGVGLLILARGLFRRLDSAYHLTVILLVAGIVVSLLKGLDYEEATFLALALAALIAGRSAFYRRASLTSLRFSPAWVVLVGVVIAGSIWLGLFSHKHVDYDRSLWWQFEFYGSAPRFLRASFGAVALAVAFSIYKLLRPVAQPPGLPHPQDIERAKAVIATSPSAEAHLALVGDKHLLFNEAGNAFIMYGVQGRTWVAMGDPVGPESERPDLAWRFRELCDRVAGRPVFYQVRLESLPIYLDLGLSPLKLGEEARVRLESFTLDGGRRKGLRYAHRRAAKEGAVFAVLDTAATATMLPELAAISDAWLAEKRVAEKGFSVGSFKPDYLRGTPCAVVTVEGRAVAFANIWATADKEELSIDLMRHLPGAPHGVMDYLFIELMLWGRDAGYRWFSLGMAPLSGLKQHPLAPLWHRIGTLIFRYGEHFYSFEGLRDYKAKFDPVWEPRYLACPGGLAVTRALVDVSRLISSGLRGIVMK